MLDRTKIAIGFLVLAATFFYLAFPNLDKLRAQLPEFGRWQPVEATRREKGHWDDAWWTVVPPGKAVYFVASNSAPIAGMYCYGYDYESPSEINVTAWQGQAAVRYRTHLKPGEDWVQIYPEFCHGDSYVSRMEFTVNRTSSPQVVRIARYQHQHRTDTIRGYLPDLCAKGYCPRLNTISWQERLEQVNRSKVTYAFATPLLLVASIGSVAMAIFAYFGFYQTLA